MIQVEATEEEEEEERLYIPIWTLAASKTFFHSLLSIALHLGRRPVGLSAIVLFRFSK
jgi:hypothetical protein